MGLTVSKVLKAFKKYRFKQLWNLIRVQTGKPGITVNYKPTRLGIFVTAKCNMKCEMCLTHSPSIPDNPFKYQSCTDMSLDTFHDILQKYPGTTLLSFIGNGEPLLNPNLFQMISDAQKRKISFSLFTNGLILDRYIDQILSCDIKSINISLNAINPEEYKRFTGNDRDTFFKCLENIKKLVAERDHRGTDLTIHCSILIDKHNYKQMPEMISFAEDLGIDGLPLCHLMPSEGPGMSAEERCIYTSDTEAIKLCQELSKKQYSVDVEFPIFLDGNKNNRNCRDCIHSMSIDGAGNISGCERQLLNTEGNGKYYEKNAFNNPHMQRLRRMFLLGEEDLPGPCQTCYNNSSITQLTSLPKRAKNIKKDNG